MLFITRAIGWVTGLNFGAVLAFLASPAGMITAVALLVFGSYGYGKHVEGKEARAEIKRSVDRSKGVDKDIGKDAAIQGANDRAANAAADAERDRRIDEYERIIKGLKDRACHLSADDVRALDRVRRSGTQPGGSVPLPPLRP
jgi:hypothetical protein